MIRMISFLAFVLGIGVIGWMGSAFVGNTLASLVTAAIATVYCGGFVELVRFQSATVSLQSALSRQVTPVESLEPWLAGVHHTLQNSARMRISGERIALPGPMLTPYLVGLLVMLGLIGTFVGMVETLKGAVAALEGKSDLDAIRSGLAAPMKGLGMAFGTSVAGVAASAILGFISTLSRRERLLVSRLLDNKIASVFEAFSLGHQREKTFLALQQQGQYLPEVVTQLRELTQQITRNSGDLSAQLLSQQSAFHTATSNEYQLLGQSLEQSLQQSVAASGQLLVDTCTPLVADIMTAMTQQAVTTQERVVEVVERQLETVTAQFSQTTVDVTQAWQAGLQIHQQANQELVQQLADTLGVITSNFERSVATFEGGLQMSHSVQQAASKELLDQADGILQAVSTQMKVISSELVTQVAQTVSQWSAQQEATDSSRLEQWQQAFDEVVVGLSAGVKELSVSSQQQASVVAAKITQFMAASEALIEARSASEAHWLELSADKLDALITAVRHELAQLREAEDERGALTDTRLLALQEVAASRLTELGQALEAPMARLMVLAAETPKAASEVIGQLREELSVSLARDNQLLDERQRIVAELNTLTGSLIESTNGQRSAIEGLVESAANLLTQVSNSFGDKVSADVSRLADMVDHFSGGSIELSALGEIFGGAVHTFAESNGELFARLKQIESSLLEGTLRSDEQMAYYVAQAREIIDYNVATQQTLMDKLAQITRDQMATVSSS